MPDQPVAAALDEDPPQDATHAEDEHRDHDPGKHGGSLVSESTLKDEIQSQMHLAMKSGEKVRLGALRLLTAAIKNREVEVGHVDHRASIGTDALAHDG